MKQVSAFPFVLGALTLILITVFVFVSPPEPVQVVPEAQETAIQSMTSYQQAMRIVFDAYLSEYQKAMPDTERQKLIEQTLNQLLRMRVPPMYKDLHLDLVLILQKMKTGIQNNPQDVLDGHVEIQQKLATVSWM